MKTGIKSFVSSKVTIKKSAIHGVGMFANEKIAKGEVVFIKGGHILKKSELHYSETINSYLPIDDNYYIGARNETEEDSIKLYENHSCQPNCGIRGEITFVAMRDIFAGEELTCDYATLDNEDYEFQCNCGSDNCRGIVTGFDWKRTDIQNKYGNYFARYLLEKIWRQE